MNKKTIIVTGASDGIGKQTAKTLAAQGHRLIIHGRNPQKLQAAYEEITVDTGNRDIEMITADFLSFAGIKRFAEAVKRKYDHIDVLINNAGAQFGDKRETTVDGHEKTMMINVFAPFYLTMLLLDSLKGSKSARVVTVASEAHKMSGKPYVEDIELKRHYSMSKAYGLSKLYIIWVMRHLMDEIKRAGIDNVNFILVHPGSVNTSLGRISAKLWKTKIVYFLWKPFMISVAKGAKSSIQAAVSPEMEGISGLYIGPNGRDKISEKYYSRENEQRVWDYCVKVSRKYGMSNLINE